MKIASIEKIKSVRAHPNADRLDLVTVLGFQCVSEKGLHKEGDIILYIQPDSVLPQGSDWAESFRKYSPGRIRAVKLRGEFSDGILVRQDLVSHLITWTEADVGKEVSEILGITHYEPPQPQDLSAKGLLPLGIPKTDEERFQNLQYLPFGELVDVTLKVDGQSWSAYYKVDTKQFGVLGRTMEYKTECSNKYTAQIDRYDIQNKLTAYCEKHGVSLCVRGESYGAGIQGFEQNPHAKLAPGLAIFSVYLIDERRYARKGDRFYFKNVATELELPHVPILEENVVLNQELITKYADDLKKIDGKPFEGVVINHGGKVFETERVVGNYENGNPIISVDIVTIQPGSFKVINKLYDSNK